jgi:hypothetical protein
MKTLLILAILLIPVLCLSLIGQSIIGSPHDMSNGLGGDGNWASLDEDQVCVFCHTPHDASPAVPLWNHEMSSGTFQPYTGLDLDHVPWEGASAPNNMSKFCLGCHDGVTALNALVNPNPTTPVMQGGFEQLGQVYYPGSPYSEGWGANIGEDFPGGMTGIVNLSNDHPISFDYSVASATDPDLHDVSIPKSRGLDFFGASNNSGTIMECSTCHDVHKHGNDAAGTKPFLNASVNQSYLCLSCHNK